MTDKCLNCPLEDEGLKLFLYHLNLIRRETGHGRIVVEIKDNCIVECEPTIKARVKKER